VIDSAATIDGDGAGEGGTAVHPRQLVAVSVFAKLTLAEGTDDLRSMARLSNILDTAGRDSDRLLLRVNYDGTTRRSVLHIPFALHLRRETTDIGCA
jgi:hypothetical protein